MIIAVKFEKSLHGEGIWLLQISYQAILVHLLKHQKIT